MVFIFLFVLSISANTDGGNKTKLRFLAFCYEYHTGDKETQASAMQYAVNLINADNRILPHYQIHIDYRHIDIQKGGAALAEFMNVVKHRKNYQFILGPYSYHKELFLVLQKKYPLPSIDDRDFLTNQLRRVNSLVMQAFKWKRVAIVYDGDNSNTETASSNIRDKLRSEEIEVVVYVSYRAYDIRDQLNRIFKRIKKEDLRIIILPNLDIRSSLSVFCEASRQGVIPPRYQFIINNDAYLSNKTPFQPLTIYDGRKFRQWKHSFKERCKGVNETSFFKAIDRSLYITSSDVRLDNNVTLMANKTLDEIWDGIKQEKDRNHAIFLEELSKRYGQKIVFPVVYTSSSRRIFDHVYKVSLGFHKLLSKSNASEILLTYPYDRSKSDAIMNAVKSADFEGVTGHFTPELEKDFLIYQLLSENKSTVLTGEYNAQSDRFVITREGEKIFKGKKILFDRMQVITSTEVYNLELVYVIWSFMGLGVIFALALFFLNNRHKNVKVVKMTSPTINNVIIIGSVLCYLSVILYGMDSRTLEKSKLSINCNIILITLSIGFTISFGALFGKTWRVYKIFASSRYNKKMKLKDTHIIGFVTALLLIDAVIFVTWMYVAPFKTKETVLQDKLLESEDQIYRTVYHQCVCDHQLELFLPLLIVKGMLITVSLLVAWLTRNVNIPVLNDSKYIGIAIYTVVVTSLFGMIALLALQNIGRFNEMYAVVAITVCLATTVTLATIMIPKVLLVCGRQSTERQRRMSTSFRPGLPS